MLTSLVAVAVLIALGSGPAGSEAGLKSVTFTQSGVVPQEPAS